MCNFLNMRYNLIFFFLVSFHTLRAQVPEMKEIYTTSLLNYYSFAPASIVVTDSSINRYVISTNYLDLIAPGRYGKRYLFGKELDSSWLNFLTKANSDKNHLTKNRIEVDKTPNFYVNLVSDNSIKKSTSKMGHNGFMKQFGVGDRIELSSILRIGNKAVVELSKYCSSLCGEGVLLFLEKQNGKWIVIYTQRLWIS